VQSTRRRRLTWLAVPLCLSLFAAACGDDDEDSGGDGGGGGESAVPECLSFADLYALIGPESEGFQNWSDAQALAEELGSTTQLPDAPLDLTGPGPESGTYDSFVELALEGIAEERSQEPTTRSDYEQSGDDNVIIQNVEGSDSSLGWVGWAFASAEGDAVRNIAISEEPGGECVEVSNETIADESYPLSRPLFIYVNRARAEENAALAPFVQFYLDDLTTWVEEGGYVPLPEDLAAETQTAWEDAGIPSDGEPSGSITISGSSTVEPISTIVAEEFDAEFGTSTTVDGPGTGDGFELFCNGETDISDASRPIEQEEIDVCEQNGIEYVELQIAFDGMAVMTSGG
jgi:phosphate transport system substrate-binding protein